MSVMRSVGGALLAGTFALSLGASAMAATPPAAGDGMVSIPWILEEHVVGGTLADVPADVVVTLLMEDGEASGSGGCNSYAGAYVLRGDALTIGPLMSTAMLCADPHQATEIAYLDDLGRVASYALDRDGLELLDQSGQPLLAFTAAAAPEITGGWIVSSYRTSGRDLVAPSGGSLLTAVLGPDGAIEGSSGCNHFTGSYTVDRDRIAIGPLNSTRMACASPELLTQETEYLAALAASNEWSQNGIDMELVDSSGAGKDTTVQLTAEIEPSYIGSWHVTGYDNGTGSVVPPVADSALTAVFSLDGAIAGDSGCNTYSGPYTVNRRSMTIGPLATSRAACSTTDLDAQEQQYLAALQAVTDWATEANGIVLRNASAATLVTLSIAAE
jgi:heat shock protein HslJ